MYSQAPFPPTLVHGYLTRAAGRFPGKEALICGEDRWSYSALEETTEAIADSLRELGVRRQDSVVIYLANSAETVLSIYGVLKARGVFIVLNSAVKPKKLGYILRDSGARFLVAHVDQSKAVLEALRHAETKVGIIWVGDDSKIPKESVGQSIPWKDLITTKSNRDRAREKKTDWASHDCIDVDLATLIYTSGSTGSPKGVISPHRHVIAAARSIIQYLKNTERDIVMNVLPLSFDYGLYQLLMTFMFGGTLVLENSFVYPHLVLERASKERVTGLPVVPTLVALLLKMCDLREYDLSHLRYITNTGAAFPPEHIRRLRDSLPGVEIFSMFGLTECKRVSYLPPEELDRRPSSVGKAIPNCEVWIVDEQGNEVAPGETGELVVRGSNVMEGYWNEPELTRKTYREGLYPGEKVLYTGDLFRMDEEGFLYFLGRRDDMIKCRGERVSAKEVEYTIVEIAGVSEVAVVGVPDEILGQAVKAFIVPSPGATIEGKEIIKHCAARLEPYMVPKYVDFVESLPRTANGKIDKKELQARGNFAEIPA
jgi:amino acid adenylation domain-containing protein